MTVPFARARAKLGGSIRLRVVLQSGYIFAEDLNVINKNINGVVHKWYCAIL